MTSAESPTGLLLIDKPLGPTSMDVCRVVKRKLKAAGAPKRVKVGHGGTLDPLATGLLVVLIGKATKLCDQIMAGAKSYQTVVDLSCFTTTDDAEGERIAVAGIPPSPAPSGGGGRVFEAGGGSEHGDERLPLNASHTPPPSLAARGGAARDTSPAGSGGGWCAPTRGQVEAACAKFVGVIQQRPPAFSALKIDGQRAYDLARAGKTVELAARPVRVDAVRVLDYSWPHVTLEIECGKGTYIRSIARDLGEALGVGGHLASLRRTTTGRFKLSDARTLNSLPDQLTQAELLPIPADLLSGGEA